MNLVDTSKLAEIYGVSRQAVNKWRDDGLRFTELSKHTILYNLDDVNQYFKNKGSKRYKEEI